VGAGAAAAVRVGRTGGGLLGGIGAAHAGLFRALFGPKKDNGAA
jgi:hypothetical protein